MKRFTLGLFTLFFAFAVQAALTVNITPNQATYQPGDTVLLAVTLSDAPPIHGGGLNARFNPNVLQAQSVIIDSSWSFANRPGVINNASGSIDDILFASFNTVQGALPVAIIQLAVVGNGDAGFIVTESKKNPFSDASGNVISFSVNNLFSYNTQVAEQPVEETPEQVTTQETSQTTAETVTATETVNTVDQEAVNTTEAADQVTETTATQESRAAVAATASSTSSYSNFSNDAGSVNLPGNTTIDNQGIVNSENDRQFFLPSGSGAIPIDVTDDNEVEGQTNNKYPDASGSNIPDNRYSQESEAVDNVDESLLASAATVSGGKSGQPEAGETQWSADTENIDTGSSNKLLTFVLILAVLFIGYIVFKVFIKKEY